MESVTPEAIVRARVRTSRCAARTLLSIPKRCGSDVMPLNSMQTSTRCLASVMRRIDERANHDEQKNNSDERGFFHKIGSVKNDPMRRNFS